MPEDVATNCDAMPYQGLFIPTSHPDQMAIMAVLLGIQPPGVERCRVLELGCADGGNLLTIAQALPRVLFLGVDISTRPVDEGRATARALGAHNVAPQSLDLAKIDDRYGLFDYIICHGVYSWVAAPVREKILRICSRKLEPNGVGYISYNVYPGWGRRGILRELMLYHTRGITDPAARVRQARALLDFLSREATPQDAYAHSLREVSREFARFPDTYLFHGHLAEDNHPVFSHEFVAVAASAGLRYVGDSAFSLEESRLSADFHQVIGRPGTDVVWRGQSVDFALNRTFRKSLFCGSGVLTYGRLGLGRSVKPRLRRPADQRSGRSARGAGVPRPIQPAADRRPGPPDRGPNGLSRPVTPGWERQQHSIALQHEGSWIILDERLRDENGRGCT